MAGKERKLTIVLAGEDKGGGKLLDETGKKTDAMGGKFADMGKKAALGFAAAGVGAVALGKEILSSGAQLTAWRLKSDVVFEGQSASVRKWADANNEAFGVTDDELVGLAASFGDLLKPMGFTASQAADMSQKVIGLSGALSSWSGGTVSAAGASDILAKAMLGETDGLKSLGIAISAADVEARLAAKGQDELTGSALEQAKAIAVQELIFEKSTDAQKAFAEGGNEALLAQNKLKAGIGELKERVVTALMPAFTTAAGVVADKLIPAFDGAVKAGKAIGEWAENNKPIVIAIAGVIGGLLTTAVIAWGVQSTIAAAKAVAGFVVTQAGYIATGIAAMAAGAQMAAAWLIGLGPIALVVAAVAGAAALIVVHWDTIVGAAKAVWNWISQNWPLLLAIITGPIGLAVLAVVRHWDTVKTKITEVKNWIGTAVGAIAGFFSGLPGKIAGFFSGLATTISQPFKVAFDNVKRWWNNTAGGFGFTTPSWIPLAGGKSFRIPEMHGGGIVPGGRGNEPVVRLQGGEGVFTSEQMAHLSVGSGPAIYVTVNVDGSVLTDGRQLAQLVVDEVTNLGKEHGRRYFDGG